jgi:hypothetical protein
MWLFHYEMVKGEQKEKCHERTINPSQHGLGMFVYCIVCRDELGWAGENYY